jgi:hypothetical protein
LGTSEESTAGGVDTLYGHVLGSGADAGSAPASAGVPIISSVAAIAAARRILVNVAMGLQAKRCRADIRGAAL